MHEDDEELARYQEALMELLARPGASDAERVRALQEGEAFRPFAGYVSAIEPCFVALGAELLRTWGRKDQRSP